MSAFGNSFGEGNPYWNINEVSRETRMNKSREFGSLWHQEVFSGAHQEDDPVKDGELFDFDGRVSSSEGRFPIEFRGLFVEENTAIFKAKPNFRRALASFGSISNLIKYGDELYNAYWDKYGGSLATTEYYYNNFVFTKLEKLAGYTEIYVSQNLSESPDSILATSIVFKRGDSDKSRFLITDDTTDFLDIILDWTTNTITNTGAFILDYDWVDDDTVVILAVTDTVVSSTGTVRVAIYGAYNDDSAVDKYSYASCAMVTKSNQIVPFVSNWRRKDTLTYEYNWSRQTTIEFWYRPYYGYINPDTSTSTYYIISDTDRGGTATFFFYYYTYDKEFHLRIEGDGGSITLSSAAFSSNSEFRGWHHVKICIDNLNNDYSLYIDGKLADNNTTDIGTWSPKLFLKILDYGSSDTYKGSAVISDLLIKDYIDKSNHHYLLNRPYYVLKEITSENTNFVISPYGINIKQGGITLRDTLSRTINLGGAGGIRAFDSQGEIIHDIPMWNMASDMLYGGHIIFKRTSSSVGSLMLYYDDADTSKYVSYTNNPTNIDLSSYLPPSFKNIRGVLVGAFFSLSIDGTKTQYNTWIESNLAYSIIYNSMADPIRCAGLREMSRASDADNMDIYRYIFIPVIIPIVWYNSIPYITVGLSLNIANMTAETASYYSKVYFYLLGFLV